MGDNSPFIGDRTRLGYGASLWTGVVPALIALGGLALIDANSDWIITGFFAVVPFTVALSGNARATAFMAALAMLTAAGSGFWNDNAGSTEFWVRFGIGLALSCFSVFVAHVIERSSRTARRLELLNDASAAAGAGTDRSSLAEALERITALAVPELADICIVDAIAGDRMDRIAVRAAAPHGPSVEPGILARGPTVQLEAAFGRDFADGPIVNTDFTDYDIGSLTDDPGEREFIRSLGVRSFIVVALCSRGRRIGVLTLIQAWSGRRHDDEDARFSQVLADRIALTLDNAGLFSDLESIEMRMDSVMDVLDEPVTITERDGKLIFANQAAVELADRDSLQELLESETGELDFDIYDEDGELLGEGMLPWQVPDIQRDAIVRMIHTGHGEETWLRVRSRMIPSIDNRPIYAVTAFDDVTEMKFAEFAQSVFASTAELLSTSTDPNLMLNRLARLLTPRLADCCAVLMPGGDGTLSLAAIADTDDARERNLREAIGGNPLNSGAPGMPEMLASREPVVYDSAAPEGWPEAAAGLAAGMDAIGYGSVLGQPLRIGDRLIGVIGFANRAERRAFTALEQRVALRISERVALAIENARIASERSQIAETLQNGLRPAAVPSIPGWSLASLYNPAGSENRAGGDFYDLFRIEGGWMAVVGDVTGHGARAASLTALARYTLRAASSLTGDPQMALAELNEALLSQPGAALCSVAAFTLDQPALGEVRVAVAGHPPPLFVHGGDTREIHPPGPLLGAFDSASWEIETVTLEPGDKLVVYTDGVVEARGSRGRFGEERLSRVLGGAGDPTEAIGRIRTELDAFAAGDLKDDAAVLAVMLEGPGGALSLAEGDGGERVGIGSGVSAS